MQLDDISGVAAEAERLGRNTSAAGGQRRRLRERVPASTGLHAKTAPEGPTFYLGTLTIEGPAAAMAVDAGGSAHLADTYLDTSGWGKGIAWVNGFNLGWFWPTQGPQLTLYVPGPVLKEGDNEVVLLELESKPDNPSGQWSARHVHACGPLRAMHLHFSVAH